MASSPIPHESEARAWRAGRPLWRPPPSEIPAPLYEVAPRASVVMPLYNKCRSVSRAVRSVLDQTFRNFELIVVDDGSDDGSGDVVREIADSRTRLLTQENQGAAVARNRGIIEARGDFVALLDADDEWAPNFLEVMVDLFERHPQAQVAGACYRIQQGEQILNPDAFTGVFAEGAEEAEVDFFEVARDQQPINCSSAVIRRSLFAKAGLFPAGITHGEDLDLWLRIGIACGEHGLVLTRRTHAIWYRDTENMAGMQRGVTSRLPSADRVLTARRQYDSKIVEYAYMLILVQAGRLRRCGRRWKSLRWLWQVRRTRYHRMRVLKELARILIARGAIPV